jgi:hypothetical protein
MVCEKSVFFFLQWTLMEGLVNLYVKPQFSIDKSIYRDLLWRRVNCFTELVMIKINILLGNFYVLDNS